MSNEMKMKVERIARIKMYKKNAKALYLLSDLREAVEYLYGKVDMEYMTEEEADSILNEISEECKDMTVGEIEQLKKLF